MENRNRERERERERETTTTTTTSNSWYRGKKTKEGGVGGGRSKEIGTQSGDFCSFGGLQGELL